MKNSPHSLWRTSCVLLVTALLLCLCSSCDKQATLFSGLSEAQANPIIAALMENGLPCYKVAGAEEGQWSVVLERSADFPRAVSLCQEQGLPKRVFSGVAEVFKKTGMVSSPSEERIRFMDALAQDLSRTISEIDGVISARVHVVLPDNDPFAKSSLPSSAAVALRCRYDVDMTDVIPQIKNLVMNSIEGLTYDKIAVTVFRDARAIVVGPLARQNEAATVEASQRQFDHDALRLLAAGCVTLLIILAGLVFFLIGKARRLGKDASSPAKES